MWEGKVGEWKPMGWGPNEWGLISQKYKLIGQEYLEAEEEVSFNTLPQLGFLSKKVTQK